MLKKALYVILTTIIVGCFTVGCVSNPVYFGNAYPLLYGIEGSDDKLLVINADGLYGYAHSDGSVVIKPQFLYARPFFEGLAAVQNKNGRFGFIDVTGKQVVPFSYYGATDYHNGKALISNRLRYLGGLSLEMISVIDREGVVQTDFEFTTASNYSEGFTIVSTYDYKNFMLDRNFKLVEVPLAGSESIAPKGFSEGLTIYQLPDNEMLSFLDINGNRAFEDEFADALFFTEGLAPAKPTAYGLWGYIDKSGKFTIEPAYQSAGNFGEGVAVVQKDGQWLLIDPSGRETTSIQIVIDTSMAFQDGLCPVGRIKDKPAFFGKTSLDYDWGFIDTTGKLVIDFQYDLVTPFKNGIAQVLVDGKIGYIDKTGKYIWEPR